MAVEMSTIAKDLGRSLVAEVADRPSVDEIWVSTEPDGVILWLLAQDIDAEEERDLYRQMIVLRKRFRDVNFRLRILKPSNYTIPLRDVLPRDAKKVYPGAA